jgi:hypothetical protein
MCRYVCDPQTTEFQIYSSDISVVIIIRLEGKGKKMAVHTKETGFKKSVPCNCKLDLHETNC